MTVESKRTQELICTSIDLENKKIIPQNSIEIHKHHVPKGYLILSKNDFGKVKTRINVGIFNKKTNFLVGEEHSLMVLDKTTLEIKTLNTSEIIENQSRYFMLYNLDFIKDYNESITVLSKSTRQEITFELNNQFGCDLGEFLAKFKEGDEISGEFEVLKAIINIDNNRLSLNKQILVNSNPEFLMGILEGYIGSEPTCVIKNNINIYNFVYILNLLGAQYSIRDISIDANGNKDKHIRFKLPITLFNRSSLPKKYFRTSKYIVGSEEIYLSRDITMLSAVDDGSIISKINSGQIELISFKDLKLIPVEDEIMYDLTMPNINAQNYFFGMTPALKNSDGDVLGIIAIHTKDAAAECEKKFGTANKRNFLNLSDGSVQNWGIKLDAALGLYNGTL